MAKPSPAPTGRKTSAQGKAHRAAALGQRPPKNPGPERATQSVDANLDIFWLKDDSLADTDNFPHPGVIFRQILDDLAEAMQEFQSAEDILLDDAELEIAAFPGATAPGKVSIKPVAKKTPAKKVAIKTIRKIPRNR